MDGASRVFASPRRYTLGGVEYAVRGRIARFYGEMEAEIVSRRPNPLKVFRDSVDLFEGNPSLQEQLYEAAKVEAFRAKSVTRIELFEWMQSLDGAVFCLWLSIRDNDPDTLTRERVRELVYDAVDQIAEQYVVDGVEPVQAAVQAVTEKSQEIQNVINQVSGEDEAGKATGPSAT
jgi:hypothetical protein